MNLASKTAGANAAVGSDGIVASSVYANGRRVADISIDDAGDGAARRAMSSG